MTAALQDAGQAVRLAAVIARTGIDPWDAHVAPVAEIADPDEVPGGPGPGR